MVAIHWFRRDLRLEDNTALAHALAGPLPVWPIFIFDTHIIDELPRDDARLSFLFQRLKALSDRLAKKGGGIETLYGDPIKVWRALLSRRRPAAVYFNRDYEPYARRRDKAVTQLLTQHGVEVHTFKDHVLFEPHEVLKPDERPYTVFTPYKKRWLERYMREAPDVVSLPRRRASYAVDIPSIPALSTIGFRRSSIVVRPFTLSAIADYGRLRDVFAADAGSYLGPHLRFGTVSIRHVAQRCKEAAAHVLLGELVWREFFMQILYHFPRVVKENFNPRYHAIRWRNDEREFDCWRQGKTGYPLVDAGMRQLNRTGYMHNRARMLAASFLTKHLLTDWRRGEAYFAQKLLDFELSSNNGNWQWAAGTGCDAAPYFRVFNPFTQQRKFDAQFTYIKKWVEEWDTADYPSPITDHPLARTRALKAYKDALARS